MEWVKLIHSTKLLAYIQSNGSSQYFYQLRHYSFLYKGNFGIIK